MENDFLGNDDTEKMDILDEDDKRNSIAHGVCSSFHSPDVEKQDNVKADSDKLGS